jgi:hypothetical protein|tara:strand:- start:1518 stop:2516 length:999 start_codon:yes stop_codon:yes gene_type:complete
MNKNLIVIFIIIAVIATLGWIFLSPIKERLTVIQIIKKSTTKQPQNTTIIERKKEEADQSQSISGILPYNDQFDEFKNPPIESFLSIESKTFKNIGPIIEDVVSVFTNPEVPQPLSDEKLASVEQQVFDILYPDYFTEGLAFTQSVFVEQGFLSENYKKIENFDSEEKIFAFVNTIIDVFEEQGFYSEDEAIKFRIGANQTWKSILDDERRIFRNKLISSKLSKKIFANILFNTHKKTSKQIINIADKLEDIFLKKAQAKECFRDGGGGGSGSNDWALCCNCGLKCTSNGCVYRQNCGKGGKSCNVPLGCKNLVGKGKAVIWDSATGICGVG